MVFFSTFCLLDLINQILVVFYSLGRTATHCGILPEKRLANKTQNSLLCVDLANSELTPYTDL